MFSAKPIKPTFKSYLPPVQTEKPIDPPIKKVEPTLLLGEIVVNEVNFVRKCISENGQDDLWGKLICTNFKVSFIPQEKPTKQNAHLPHLLLGEHDMPLTCLDQVVTVNDTNKKRKVLSSNQKLKFNPTELILYCKDLRIIRFCFDEAGPESARKVCLAIAHYSHPADLHLLFGFEYQGRRYHERKATEMNGSTGRVRSQTPAYDRPSDWDREIKRTSATEWRVCSINERFGVSQSLPEYIVVPASLADQDLRQLAIYFSDSRIPLWCWNHPNGSALVRMSNVADPIQQKKSEQRIFNAITKSHPQRSEVIKLDLEKSLPNIQDIQSAFCKLRQVCVIDPFEESEERWLTYIENSRWLEYVRAFLKQSAEIVFLIEGKSASVVITEEEDRDLNCAVSSLVQLMLDPHYRSLSGFQSLVQKEWVMAGHRFLDRCNHLKRNDKEECPLFLLFLDCVWQMINQYPAAFEFTETYLTVLTDSMWIPLHSTFLFNSSLQRTQHLTDFAKTRTIPHEEEQSVYFPPVWEWSQQFSAKEQTLFNNPMYVGKSVACVQNGEVRTFRRTKKAYSATMKGSPAPVVNGLREEGTLARRVSFMSELKPEFSAVKDVVESPSERFFRDWFSRPFDHQGLLLPMFLPSHVGLWKLFFLRWVPEACIPKGGAVTTYHKLCQLVDEIEMLQFKLKQYKGPSADFTPEPSSSKAPLEQRRMYFTARSPDEPPSLPDFLTSSFPFTPMGNLCRRSTLGTPISKFLNEAKIWLSTETLNDTV